jgi:hypothetical protein
MAATIFVIRHAEKPLGDGPPHGVDIDGKQDGDSLTPRGWQRAGALVALFAGGSAGSSGLTGAEPPSHLFAALVTDGGASRRPRETLEPLAQRLGIGIDTRFPKEQVGEVARAALALDGVVVIAWEHHLLPALAEAILQIAGAASGLRVPAVAGAPVPAVWPDDCFDMVWAFEPERGGGLGFRQVPQSLLAGDRAEPIPA